MVPADFKYDFCGWATVYGKKCTDGRTIMKDAFKHQDGTTVPLVWNHEHSSPDNLLGEAYLEHRNEGVYAYGKFDDELNSKYAKTAVMHGIISGLSIHAGRLKQFGPQHDRYVEHGDLYELSLVYGTANPKACIEDVIVHGDNGEMQIIEDEGIIYTGETIVLNHADNTNAEKEDKQMAEETNKTNSSENDKSIEDIINSMNEEQQAVYYYSVGEALKAGAETDDSDEDDSDDDEVEHSEGGNYTMKKNLFENTGAMQEDTLMHADIVNNAIADAKRFGSLKESVLQHAAANNITDIGELFPKEKDLNVPPTWIKDDDSWVSKVMGAVHHTPFSRVRALFAKMDEKEARARGYIKGNQKADLKLAVLKRTTSPTTVYIKMKMDRDDVVDIDFDVLSWIRAEMRNNLNRELALGFLLGDKRDPSDDDKIDELCIRPVLTDDDMYTIKYTVTDGTDHHNDFNSASENDSEAKGVVRAAIKSRKEYKGSGTPTFFTTEDLLTELLLIEDQNGRRIYESITSLATAMRVKEIVTVPEMEQHTDIYGIIVNMNDYNTGADKGGEVNMFDDFDIDYNQQKYLMETRCSGALVKPYSAIVLKKSEVAAG